MNDQEKERAHGPQDDPARPDGPDEAAADLDASQEEAEKITGGGREKPADFVLC